MRLAIAIGYVAIPAIFYAGDVITYLLDPTGAHRAGVQLPLLLVAVGSFLALRKASASVAEHPVASAVAASVGLVHWFGPYMVFSSRFVWGTADALTKDVWRLMLFNLFVPLVTLSGAAYDATLFTLPAASLAMVAFAASRGR
jgi:hypothetical protein